ncbi:aminotransferase class IV [Compostimonas suwonensis]|uniref:Branched-subunit amino acid aminotransferase/4-amino-4-deoxychorismate lyase n=1 Tax=Compostimonas suwonensis TaxID=1048394 RepID=A0A2M9BZ70_9MICO|nr:aminotransferase class IV [Compostimonas suwonensis]PJJ63378.1 branched-subunit amino acid aminotransferase/4-amino-4-deoxychorismate lyase [Compostimonas suwonensis]
MTTIDTTFRWLGGALHPLDDCDLAESTLAVADSWLVTEGRARALEAHRERFGQAVARLGGTISPDELELFWAQGLALIPREGEWFPRAELLERATGRELRFRVRPAPALQTAVSLWTAPNDPRRTPAVKGPDIPALSRLRQNAQKAGATEAVILGENGTIVDGATTALLWWRSGTLIAPTSDLTRVASVTARTIRMLAGALGTPGSEERARPSDLDGAELWAVNALHGIRPATSWIDGPQLAAPDAARLSAWRRRLEALRRPLPS